ncbi:hypothetical protein ACFOHT_04985 [Massilia oculi]|uniref:hypothetical protein n=1 Tax=Massilia oculi TaxID=945844 RepID=UPI0013B3A21F|nr:hypothetical protein [Massilia oculi]
MNWIACAPAAPVSVAPPVAPVPAAPTERRGVKPEGLVLKNLVRRNPPMSRAA